MILYRYDEQIKERENQIRKEDLSDMVAEHAAKQRVSLSTYQGAAHPIEPKE